MLIVSVMYIIVMGNGLLQVDEKPHLVTCISYVFDNLRNPTTEKSMKKNVDSQSMYSTIRYTFLLQVDYLPHFIPYILLSLGQYRHSIAPWPSEF